MLKKQITWTTKKADILNYTKIKNLYSSKESIKDKPQLGEDRGNTYIQKDAELQGIPTNNKR